MRVLLRKLGSSIFSVSGYPDHNISALYSTGKIGNYSIIVYKNHYLPLDGIINIPISLVWECRVPARSPLPTLLSKANISQVS